VAVTQAELASAIRFKVHDGGVVKFLRAAMAKAPNAMERSMGRAVEYWRGNALRSAPTRYTRKGKKKWVERGGRKLYPPRYSKTGRGTLNTSFPPGKVFRRGDRIVGAIVNYAPYAAYLEFGTDRIAGGQVKKWKPGRPTITDWLWRIEKRSGSEMPFIRPHIPKTIKALWADVNSKFLGSL